MLKNINKVILIGNLGADPELAYTLSSNIPDASFPLATNEAWINQSGEKQERVEWHRVVVWRKTAEACNEYLRKGSKVYVEGKLRSRSWEDHAGQKRYITEVVAEDVVFLDAAGGHGQPPERQDTEAPPESYRERNSPGKDDLPF
jgi:single-strand DNA-binding protein